MSEHNPNAWQDGFDAWQNGYDDTMYDGIDTSSEMPCKCDECRVKYAAGQEAAFEEIFGNRQSAQPLRAGDGAKWWVCDCGMDNEPKSNVCCVCGSPRP